VHHRSTQLQVKVALNALLRDRLGNALRVEEQQQQQQQQ
jgi:hypothetical protein